METLTSAVKAMWITNFTEDASRLAYMLKMEGNEYNTTEAIIESVEFLASRMTQIANRLHRYGVKLDMQTISWAERYMKSHAA